MTAMDPAALTGAAFAEAALLLERSHTLIPGIVVSAEAMAASLAHGGTILICGNGGSAADAQHFAAELTGRFEADRPALAAIALHADTSALTAIANDYGFARVFARQLEALGKPGDVLVAISTSGASPNVLAAVEAARAREITTIGLLGRDGGPLAERCDHALIVPHQRTARIQEIHGLIIHCWCALLERAIAG